MYHQFKSCIDILEQSLDNAYSIGCQSGLINQWEEMMLALEFSYHDILSAYSILLERTSDPIIRQTIEEKVT